MSYVESIFSTNKVRYFCGPKFGQRLNNEKSFATNDDQKT